MSMISCPECQTVNSFEKVCPNCGAPVRSDVVPRQKREQNSTGIFALACLAGLFCAIVLMGLLGRRSPSHRSQRAVSTHSVSTAPRTVLGNASSSREKHLADAREFLLMDARASVRKGLMTKRQFEEYTGVEY